MNFGESRYRPHLTASLGMSLHWTRRFHHIAQKSQYPPVLVEDGNVPFTTNMLSLQRKEGRGHSEVASALRPELGHRMQGGQRGEHVEICQRGCRSVNLFYNATAVWRSRNPSTGHKKRRDGDMSPVVFQRTQNKRESKHSCLRGFLRKARSVE